MIMIYWEATQRENNINKIDFVDENKTLRKPQIRNLKWKYKKGSKYYLKKNEKSD